MTQSLYIGQALPTSLIRLLLLSPVRRRPLDRYLPVLLRQTYVRLLPISLKYLSMFLTNEHRRPLCHYCCIECRRWSGRLFQSGHKCRRCIGSQSLGELLWRHLGDDIVILIHENGHFQTTDLGRTTLSTLYNSLPLTGISGHLGPLDVYALDGHLPPSTSSTSRSF